MAVMGASGLAGMDLCEGSIATSHQGKGRVTSAVRLANKPAAETVMPKSSRTSSNPSGLQLGRAVEWPTSPDAAQIDRVPNPQENTDYVVRFTVPEFTSLCPVTGQPDFAHLVIDYVPSRWLLE